MQVDEQFAELVLRSEGLQASHAWPEAGAAWESAAAFARRHGVLQSTAQCLDAAGECYRRADDPGAAARVFAEVRTISDHPLSRIKLAAVQAELGDGRSAIAMLEECLGAPGPLGTLALDTLITTLHSYGPPGSLAPHVDALTVDPAATFRRGQQHRLRGELEEAGTCFAAIAQGTRGPGAEAARAGALGELGEIALLQGDYDGSVALFTEALELHDADGRISLRIRGEIGRARAMVESGAFVLTHGLQEGRMFAESRGMRLLLIDIDTTLGMALAEREPSRARALLGAAVSHAVEIGARRRAGRARYESATRVGGPGALRALRTAEEELCDSIPRASRATLARATILVDRGSAEGQELAGRLVARFAVMGMQRDGARARALLRPGPRRG